MAPELNFPIRLTKLGDRADEVVGLIEAGESPIEPVKARSR
jgi:hypothetical protein